MESMPQEQVLDQVAEHDKFGRLRKTHTQRGSLFAIIRLVPVGDVV